MTEYLIAFGANLARDTNDLASTLAQALALLEENPALSVRRVSRWYRTPAVPAGSGPDFVNGTAALDSDLTPQEILQILHGVEEDLGRTRPERWAPRVCDLDLLAAGAAVLPDAASVKWWMSLDESQAQTRTPDQLILPHPRLHLRAFVLVPTCDIAPDWVHPVLQLSVEDLRARLTPEMCAGIEPLD